MQVLKVKIVNEKGEKSVLSVKIIRAWGDSGGAMIYLHHNGIYGYKDGSPIRDAKELNIIGDVRQKTLALSWWERIGHKISQQYYDEREKALIERQEAGIMPLGMGDISDLDAVQYIRRPVKDRKRAAFSDPHTWYEWFEARPDWWGQAAVIELGAYRYEIMASGEAKTEGSDEEASQGAATSAQLPGAVSF